MIKFLLLVAPTLIWALQNKVPTRNKVVRRQDSNIPIPKPPQVPQVGGEEDDGLLPPAEDWKAYVDIWKDWEEPPESLYHYMLYAQSYYRNIEEYPTLDVYQVPNEYVSEIVSPGDSFTAGIGSNGKEDHFEDSGTFAEGKCGRYKQGWPEKLRDHSGWNELQFDGHRQNNFGACSGHVISQIKELQLGLGDPVDGQFKAIGKPQIAVLTAGGNDFLFADVILKCVLRLYGVGSGNCENTLKEIEDKISKRDEAIKMYQDLFAHLIVAGRLAKGATNPAEFQVYIGAYIPFFNATDTACNDISWNVWGNSVKLTTDFRLRLNNMVEGVNSIIQEAVEGFAFWGVYYVDGYIPSFHGHQWCAPMPEFDGKTDDYVQKYHSKKVENYGSQQHFWSWKAQWDPPVGPMGEGDDHPIKSLPGKKRRQEGDEEGDEYTSKLLEKLIPDPDQRAKVYSGEADPGDFNKEAFESFDSFKAAVLDNPIDEGISEGINEGINEGIGDRIGQRISSLITNDGWYRVWHPKGSGQTNMANAFFDKIKTSRGWDFKGRPSN